MPRKTRKQKLRASFEPVRFSFVNREFRSRETNEADQPQQSKKLVNSDQTTVLASTKKDLFKTFILASIILISEAVLYFFWN